MRLEEYDEIIQYIVRHPSKCSRIVLSDVVLKFSGRFPHHTLLSIFLTNLQRQVKLTYHAKTKADNLRQYFSIYQKRIKKVIEKRENAETVSDSGNCVRTCSNSNKSSNGEHKAEPVLIELSNQFELPPCLMARLVVEQYIKSIIAQTGNVLNRAHLEEKTLNVSQANTFDRESNISQINKALEAKKNIVCELDSNMHMISGQNKTQFLEQKTTSTCQNEKLQQTKLDNTGKIHPVQKRRVQLCSDASLTTGCSIGANDVKKIPPAAKPLSAQTSVKNKLASWMKDPDLIPDSILQEQVLQCMSYDVCYGPINDAIRHSIGLEYEEKLVESVKKLNLPFLDENDLRKRGYDKTPDVKLEVPIVVDSHPICWIESKASFGDLETHSEYLRDQYYSYWNRFGPGLVIYWFGFIDQIAEGMLKQGILIRDAFPSEEKIVLMDP